MAENQPSQSQPSNHPFQRPDVEPILLDVEYLIRQAFEEDARRGYELLFRRYYRPLCSQAVRFVYSRAVAEDLVSEVFFSFWKNQAQLHITTTYQAYLYSAVRKRAYSYLQREFHQEMTITDENAEGINNNVEIDPEQLLQYTELYQRIEETVRTLPPQCQRVFVMSRFEGKKHREIADELQISPKTIEAHLSRALSQLRQVLRMGLFCGLMFFVPATSPSEISTPSPTYCYQ